jgi:hypothetical protein
MAFHMLFKSGQQLMTMVGSSTAGAILSRLGQSLISQRCYSC